MPTKIERLEGRLATLLTELASNADYATGRRRYARSVAPDDAADLAEAFHEQVDLGVATRAEVVKKKLKVIACSRGCNACCNQPIMVTLPEAFAVARWLARPENHAVREAFLGRFPAWQAQAGAKAAELAEAGARGDEDGAARLHREARSMCPLNQDGDCTVYPVRPMICRSAHALTTPLPCQDEAAGQAEVLHFPPLDEFIAKAKRVLWAAHHAMPHGERRRTVPLVEAVSAYLASA